MLRVGAEAPSGAGDVWVVMVPDSLAVERGRGVGLHCTLIGWVRQTSYSGMRHRSASRTVPGLRCPGDSVADPTQAAPPPNARLTPVHACAAAKATRRTLASAGCITPLPLSSPVPQRSSSSQSRATGRHPGKSSAPPGLRDHGPDERVPEPIQLALVASSALLLPKGREGTSTSVRPCCTSAPRAGRHFQYDQCT